MRLQAGKTPGIVFSGPGGEQHLLAFDSKALGKLVTKLGRTAWACSVFDLQIQGEDGSSRTVRALVGAAAAAAAASRLAWLHPTHTCSPRVVLAASCDAGVAWCACRAGKCT